MTAVAGTMGFFILLTIGSSLTSLKLSSTAATLLSEQPRAIEGVSDVKDLEKSMVGVDAMMNRYLASVNPEDKKAFYEGVTQAKALLEKIESRDPKVQPLAGAFDAWIEAVSKSQADTESGRRLACISVVRVRLGDGGSDERIEYCSAARLAV